MKFDKVLKLITALIAASSVGAIESLKSKAGGFRIGCATNSMNYNNNAYVSAMSNFNYMVAENACKMAGIQPQPGKYDFKGCDDHYNKAKELGMAFRGHCLIWHGMPPKWFEETKGEDLRKAIVDHITTVLKYYDGKIDAWDIVNEAIDDSSNGPQWKMRNSFLYQNVPDFIDLAFKTARAASPTTKLFYNDYNTEGIWGKSEAVYNFVKDLKKRNIPIDGVGLQYHVSTQTYPQYAKINDLISRYCQLGVEVHITEMDVSNKDGNTQKQDTVFSEALKACLSNSCCTGFLVWGVGDKDSWLGADAKGLLFDSSYQPKSAYNALLQTLGEGRASSNSNTPAPPPSPEQSNNQQPSLSPEQSNNQQPPPSPEQSNNQQPPPQEQNNNQQPPPSPEQNNNQQPPPQEQNNNQQPPPSPEQNNNQQPPPQEQNNNQQPPPSPEQNNNQQPPPQEQNNNQQPPPSPEQNNNQQPPQQNDNQWWNNNNQWDNNNNNNNQNGNNASSNNANCAGMYAQCGGKGFSGPTCCAQGTCKVMNEYYSQCI